MHVPCHDAAGRLAPAARRARGFTLIEILVVMVIISVIISAATLAIGVLGGDRQAEDQSRRLWAVLQQAREEAELQGRDVGLYLSDSSYEFLRFDPRINFWLPIPDDPLYAPRQMPAGLRFRAVLDGRAVVLKPQLPTRVAPKRRVTNDQVNRLGEDDEEEEAEKAQAKGEDPRKREDKDNPPPQVIVLSSGEVMPFEVAIERDAAPAQWRVIGTADNDLRVEQLDAQQRWQIILQTKQIQDEKEKPRARQ